MTHEQLRKKLTKLKSSIEIKQKNVDKCQAHVDKLKSQLEGLILERSQTEKELEKPEVKAEGKQSSKPQKKAKTSSALTATRTDFLNFFEGANINPKATMEEAQKLLAKNAERKGFLYMTSQEGLPTNALVLIIEKAFADHRFHLLYIKGGLHTVTKVFFGKQYDGAIEQIWNAKDGLVKPIDYIPKVEVAII